MNFRQVSRETKLAKTVADQDIQIRGWSGGRSSWSWPLSDKGEPGLKKPFFQPLGPQFGLNIRGPGTPGTLPWICSCHCKEIPRGKNFRTLILGKKAKSYQCNEICLAGHVGYTILDWKDKLGLLNFTSVQFLVCAGASIYGSKLQRAKWG